MEAKAGRGGEPQLQPHTSMNESATPPIVNSFSKASTASVNTATSLLQSSDGEDDNRAPNSAALSTDSAVPSSSIASSSFSMFSQSTTTRRGEEGRKEEGGGRGSAASLVPTLTKRSRALSSSPAATRTSIPAEFTAPFVSPAPTRPEGPLPLLFTAALVDVAAVPASTAGPLGSAIGTNAPMHGHPLSPSPTAPPSSTPFLVAPAEVPIPSVGDAAEEGSAPPAAPATLPANAAAAVDEKVVDAGAAKCVTEDDESEGSGASASRSLRGDNGVPMDGRAETPPNVEQPPALLSECLPATSMEPPPPPSHASADSGAKHSEGHSSAPDGPPQAPPSAPAPFLRESPEEPPSLLRIAPEEQLRHSGRLSGTHDSGSDTIEEAATSGDEGGGWGIRRRPRRSSAHRSGAAAERGEAQSNAHESSGRCGQLRSSGRRRRTRELDTEASHTSPLHASESRSHQEGTPVCGAFPSSTAALDACLTSMVGAAANDVPQQPAAHQHSSSSFSAFTHAHAANMQASTAGPSLFAADVLASTHTTAVSPTQSSLLPAQRRRSPSDLLSSGWPDAVFQVGEDEGDGVAAPEGEALQSSTQAQGQQGQEERACTEDDMAGKATVVAIAAGEMSAPPSLSPATHVREAAAVAVAPLLLLPKEHQGDTRAEALASASASTSLSTPVVAMARGAMSLNGGLSTTAAPALSTAVLPAPAHPSPFGSSPSAPAASHPPPRSTTHHQPPPPSSPAVAALAPSSATEKEAEASRGVHDVGRAVATSASAASIEPAAVRTALHPVPISPALPVPAATATAAAGFIGEPHREAYPASLLCINRPISLGGAVGDSGSVETAGSFATLKSTVAGHNRLSLGSVRSNAMVGQRLLSMAQFADRWTWSEEGSRHGSDADNCSNRRSGKEQESTGSWPSHTAANPRHEDDSSGSWYSYSYGSAYSTEDITGSTTRGLCSSVTVSAPCLQDEREGAVTGGTAAASGTEMVNLVEYEEVTPIVRGQGGLLGWLCCGRQKATGGVRRSRMEVHRVCFTAEDTRRDHSIGLSALHAEQHKDLPRREGSTASPVATAGAVRANITTRSEDKAERQAAFGGMRSGGAVGSEGSGPPRGLGSATETPHSSEKDTAESVDEGVDEAAAYAGCRGSTSSYADGEAPLISRANTLAPPHDGAEEMNEGDSGLRSHGEEAETAPAAAAAADQKRTPPPGVVGQAACSSSVSAPFAKLDVAVSVNTKLSSSAHCYAEADGTHYPGGVGVLGSDGSVPGGDASAPSAATDAVEAPDHHNRAVGCTGRGGGVEEREEGAATTASTAPHPLWALLVSTEELPRLRAWDAEPPVAASTCRLHQEREAARLEAKYNEEAIAAAEEAQQAFHQAVQELMVRPPRQCVFVSVHGLRHWCSALHCLRQAPRAGLANGAAAALAGVWRDAWGGNAQAGAPIIEDPKWMDVRLAIYMHNSAGERLLAAGSVFSLPSNLEALRRCLGCGDGGGGDGIVEHPSTGGYGRDSWSDLLVFQLPESASEGSAEGMQQAEVRDHDCIVSITSECTTGHCSDRGDGGGAAPSHRASECGLPGCGNLGSLGGCGILYVKLEERDERWVSLGDACAGAAATRAGEAASCGIRAHSPVKDARPATAAATTIGGGAEGLVTSSQQDEENTPQLSVGRRTEPSSPSSSLPLAGEAAPPSSSASETKAGRDCARHAIGATADMDSVHVRASDDGGADERAQATGTRLEECWRPLAVSPPLLPADLCQLQSDQPPLHTALGTTEEAAASAVACPGQLLPQLSCRLRWAQEPQPRFRAAPEPAPRVPPVEQGLSAWASLGTAIKEYERVCRCASTDAVSAVTAENHKPFRPLTVLWNTIPSHLAAENDKLREVRKASVAAAPLERWCGGELAPRGHAMEALMVCSVVMRCAAAILFAHELADVPESRYCPPTSISVTGGCDGVVVEGAAAVGADDAHGTPVAHRAPVMQYNITFHTVLTRDPASSLLFTVHGAASPADVFGFAVWTPFDAASAAHVQSRHRHGEDAGVGGVADVWLPLFAPASADATPLASVPAQQRKVASSGVSSATLSSTNKGHKRSTTGLLLVGWLHCDVEAVFLPSLAETAVQQLWNGSQRSFSSLAAAAGGESGHDGCCMGHGISVEDDTLVDFSVMEGAGLRPLATPFGMPLSPTPLRWDDSATWGNNGTCAHVYCEVLALRRQQGTSHQVPRWPPHAAGVFALASSSSAARAAVYRPHSSGYRLRAAARADFDAMSFASESDGHGQVARRVPLSDSGEEVEVRSAYDTRTWTSVTGAVPNAVLPVTDSVAHTNHPRWEHTFRCGLALLSSLHLRVFDVCQHRRGGDGSETKSQAEERGSVRARLSGASGGRARLLGTATVSSWLLRRLLCRPSGEGCAWLPLLWSPGAAAESMTASVTANGKGSFQQHFFPAVCNGFVLVEWRRVPQATAVARLPCTRGASSWCASVTRRLLDSEGRHTTASAARRRLFLGTFKKLHDFPQRWYHPMPSPGTEPNSVTAVPTAYSRQLGWITPEVVPWLRIHEVRLQWPWLQHLLCMHGGQAQLSLRYRAAQGETRLLAQCLLVPLCELAGPSTSTVCGGRPSRVHSRETRDVAAVYGMVLSAAPSDDTAPSPNAAAAAEATLCLPATPFIEVQVWWYPRHGTGSAADCGLDVPPRFIGRGEWRFPAHEAAAEVRGVVAGTDQGAFEEALNARPTTADAADIACLSDGEEESEAARGPAPLPTALRSFFTPHEADLRVAPVHSTGVPQHVEGGVLTWRLMSVPRLLCNGWGEVPPAMPRPLPESSSCVAGPCGDVRRPLRPSPAAVPASTWVWPDVGTPAVVHVQVCDMICFDDTDGPGIDTARATAAVQIAVSGTTCVGSSTQTPPDESAAITGARCWMYPGDAPPPDAPRVAYALSPVYNTAANATDTGSNMGGYQQQHQLPPSQASWALKTPLRPPQATAVAGSGEKSAARSAMPGVGASRSPTVEVQWPPRRFGWVDDAPPSLSVWVMAPPSLSGGAGAAGDTAAAAAKERVWGAVRLPGLAAFTSTSGVLWLPLFQSYATPALAAEVSRCAAAAEDVALSSSSSSGSSGSGACTGTGEHCGAVSPPPPPSTVERVHGGIAVTALPQSTLASGDTPDSLVMVAAPRAAIVVRHVGFVAVRYAHNMQRRAADAVTTGGTEPSAAGPRVLLVRAGSLHRRFPVAVAARHPLSYPSSPPPSESCTPVSEAPLTPPSDAALTHCNAAWSALPAADNAADTAAATGALLGNASGGADVLLGFEAHQLSVRTSDADTGRDDSREASSLSGIAIFPLPQRDAGDGGSLQLRVQSRVGASAAMATNTMYFDPGGDEATPESAQWVPLVVRRRLHDAYGAGYDGEGESVVAELLVQWRVVDLSAATAPPRSTFLPTSLQCLVRECCGGGGASCSYTVLPALSAAAQVHQNPLVQSCAGVQRRAGFLELPGRERRGQDTITAEQASRVLSRVLRTIQPRRRRCVYLTLDQLLVQCSVRQRRMWAALQRGTTASPQEMLADGGYDDAASAPIRFRLEVQLRWPVEWSAVWRGIASLSPRRMPRETEIGAAASLPPAAAASATSTADTVFLNVWVDSGEGVFAESSSPAAPGAAVADEAAAYASEECLLSCASLPPLCLVLPSAEDIDHLLGDLGLAARFCLTFALFAVPQWRGDRDAREREASDVCVGTGRTPMTFSPSMQFGLTSLLPSISSRSGGGPPCADAAGAGAKGGVATVPPLLRWRARVTESLPVPSPASSILCISPKVRDLAVASGTAMGDDGARCGEQMPSWSRSSSPVSSSAEKDEVIEGDGHTRAAGATAASLLPRTPALAHVAVTRIELCGVDVSLARGAAQRHRRALPPATVTVMTTDVTDAAAAPTDRRGGAANAVSTVLQLLPCLLSPRPTAASPPIHATSTPSLPMTRLDQTQSVPPPPQRYMWSTDVCIAAPVSQLIFYVSVPVAALRSARVEEAWLPPRSHSSEAEQQDAAAQSVDAHWRSRHGDEVNVVGKAAYALDLLAQVEGARRPCDDSRRVSAAQTADCARDVVLEVESLVHGRCLGRLWVQVDIAAADLLMRDAASVFFISRMTLSVQRCSGFAVGDVPLTYRAEETYVRLRERAALLCERRGRLPRRLRQQLNEIRQIRRQLRQGQIQQRDGVLASHAAPSTAGVVRLTSAWGEQDTGASSTYTSKPFALPTATELVRRRCRATTSSSSTCAPLLCLSHDTKTAQTTNDATATVQLELCQASSGVTVAAGQMVLPLRSARTLWRDGAWQPPVSTVTSPLSVRVDLQPCTVSEVHTPRIRPVAPPGGEAEVTATWAVHPARGDTWLTCICLKPTVGGDGAATPPRQLLLRWVYCFEATAYPETEHAVDMPLHLRSSSTANDHGGKRAQTPHACHRLRNGAPVYWSGAAMQLPRIGAVGATIKRVELLEVTSVSCAHLLVGGEACEVTQASPLRSNLPTRDACMTVRLAVHVWTVADELCFEARRRQAQDSGEDALVWLTCGGASAAGSRRCRPGYEVLLGLYTSNSLAKCAAQLLEQRGLRATGAEMPIAPLALAMQPPRLPPHTGVTTSVACNAAGPIKADESSSPPTAPHVRCHASTSPAKGVVVPGAVGSGGGVAMRALTFRCGAAALATLELGQVDTISCCVLAARRRCDRGAALHVHQPPLAENGSGAVDRPEASTVVLDAGRATSLLQERCSAEDLPQAATGSSPPLASPQLTATWLPTLELSHSTMVAPCAAAAPPRADAHHGTQKARLQEVRGALLRVMLPLVQPDPVVAAAGDGKADDDAGSDSGDEVATLKEEQFRIEVTVRGRRCGAGVDEAATTAYYVSDPLCASDIFRSARSYAERNGIGSSADTTAAAAGGDSPLCMSPSQWMSTLAMRLVPAPASAGTTDSAACESSEKEQETGPLSPRMDSTATMEVTWALDVLGVLRTSACAAGVVLASAKCARRRADRDAGDGAHRTEAVFDSLARMADDTDEDDNAGGGGVGMWELEAYAAWTDFLAAQDSVERMRAAQADLRHWRCTIVGVEVSGVELPSWCSTGVNTGADTEDEVHDTAQCTSLLAQLVLPMGAARSVAGADAEGQPTQDSAGTGHHHRRRLRSKGGLVMGVARTTVTRMDRDARLDTEAAPTSCDRATVKGGACSARSVAPVSSSSRPRSHRYTGTFTPLSWSMAVSDMIGQAAATAHREGKGTAATVGGDPAAGITVWRLLACAPPSSSSARNSIDNSRSTTQNTTQLVYNLGATQLTDLLHECALYLVQVLARWLGDVYTTEEREALLEAAALYPTQWMPLAPVTPIMDGTQGSARVRFKCAYSYHGPVLLLPKSLSTVVPSRITAPRVLADAVCCAQLDHMQLVYTSLDGAEVSAATAGPHRRNGTSAAAAWPSRLSLVMRVLVTTERAVNGAVVQSRNVAHWHTQLTPGPCGSAPLITEAVRESGTVAPFAPAASSPSSSPSAATPQPTPAPTAPVATPVPVTVLPSAGGAAESIQNRGGEVRQRIVTAASAAPSSVTEVVPLLPTTSFFCWQPPSLEEAMEGCSAAHTSVAVPAAHATETTTATLVEIVLMLADEKTEEGDSAAANSQDRLPGGGSGVVEGTVVGRGQLRLGCSSLKEVVWDAAEGRVESGWRLYMPLSVRLPVTAGAALPRGGCDASTSAIAPGEGAKGEPQPSLTFSLDLLIFTAPSMAQVAALQASRAAQAEQRRRSLFLLQRTEEVLAASATTDYHLHEQGSELNKRACAIAAGEPRATLRQFSQMWVSRKPYQLLRVPPIVICVDTFAVLDGIPSTTARRVAALSAGGNKKDGPTRLSQTLWTTLRRRMVRRVSTHDGTDAVPCPSQRCSGGGLSGGTSDAAVSVEVQVWLVDEQTGEVRVPVWTLLSDGPPLLRSSGGAATCNPSHAPSLASHLHAGRAILRNAQRLRLDWCSEDEGARPQSMSLPASLAGLLGGASVSYMATNGSACTWVSGGLRRRCAQHTRHGTCHALRVQGNAGGGNSGRGAVEPVPPLLRSAAHHTSPGRRRRQPLVPPPAARVDAQPSPPPAPPGLDSCTPSCQFDYALYGSHFLSCAAAAQDGQATTPVWRCEAHACVTRSFPAASPSATAVSRLFHSATLVGGRIWLLGGWISPAGATTLPSMLAALVGTSRLVERRRREVRQAVTHGSDNAATGDLLSLAPLAECSFRCASASTRNARCRADNAPPSASLCWCEVVQSVQCLNDGFPAPPVDAPSPSSQAENSKDAAGATRRLLAAPPRLACHVAVACGDRYVAVFGGLMAPTGTDDRAPVATSAVHIYDTVQGTWSAQYEPDTGDVQGEWPVARYGHCVTPVPGTGGARQPRSYFVFGGATTTPSCRTVLVPPGQLLWIWTPVPGVLQHGRSCAVEDVSVHSAWRRVQLPVELTTPLAGRFLSQLHAYAAVEVAAAVCGAEEPLDDGAAVPSDPGLTSMLLCVAGGMTAPALHTAPAATHDQSPFATKASASDAYRAFCECVEPWFAHPASDVASVLVACVCEHQQQLPSLPAYSAPFSQTRTRTP